MPNITYPAVEEYLYSLLPERNDVLLEIEEQARQRKIPIVGPAVGGLLHVLARVTGARRVFELGSAVGYSTIWWALAIGEGGKVVYTDSDPKNAEEAKGYFIRAGVNDRIEIHTGDALERFAREPKGSWDIVFNDVDKKWYPDVLPLAAERVKRGGLFITDNVLWSGRVADSANQEESTIAIRRFNQRLLEESEFFTTILPLRDGVSIARRN